MTKRAYKLAALFFFVLGVGSAICALARLQEARWSISINFLYYLGVTMLAFFAAGCIRLSASRKA